MTNVFESGAPTFDPFDASVRADPYPAYADVLAGARVHRFMLGVWILAHHADVEAVLRSPDVSSDPGKSTLVELYLEANPDGEPDGIRPFLFLDPPDHTRLRKLVQKAFTPRVVEQRHARVAELAESAVDLGLHRGGLDAIGDLGYEVAVQVICDLLGVPRGDESRFKSWSDALARSLDPDMVLPPDVRAQRDSAIGEFGEYMRDLIGRRRSDPGEDLLSALVHVQEEGDVLTEDELVSTSILLLIAGHETTVNLVGNGVLAFCRHPDQYDLLGSDPALARNAVEEVLRYDPPIQMTGRTVMAPMTFGDVELGERDMVFLLLAAANRDPAVFDEPDRFDITRTPGPHLAFGQGIHYCLGAALARLEGRVVFETLARRVETLELAVDEITYKENFILRGLEALPVSLTAS